MHVVMYGMLFFVMYGIMVFHSVCFWNMHDASQLPHVWCIFQMCIVVWQWDSQTLEVIGVYVSDVDSMFMIACLCVFYWLFCFTWWHLWFVMWWVMILQYKRQNSNNLRHQIYQNIHLFALTEMKSLKDYSLSLIAA